MSNDPIDQTKTIKHLLATVHTIAVVGISSNPERAGYYVPEYLQSQGYHIIPVNPNLSQALGERAYPDLGSVPDPFDLVLLFRRSEDVQPFVEQAIQLGAKAVWMQKGIVNEAAAQIARQAGLDVVMDACMKEQHEEYAIG
jgi:uncharacterized protein